MSRGWREWDGSRGAVKTTPGSCTSVFKRSPKHNCAAKSGSLQTWIRHATPGITCNKPPFHDKDMTSSIFQNSFPPFTKAECGLISLQCKLLSLYLHAVSSFRQQESGEHASTGLITTNMERLVTNGKQWVEFHRKKKASE